MKHYSDGFALVVGKTAIKFNEYKRMGRCNKCGKIGGLYATHFHSFIKSAFKSKQLVDCGGKFERELRKHQGSRVKKYRKALERERINFTELMFINVCICGAGFPCTFEPGQMVVVFTW